MNNFVGIRHFKPNSKLDKWGDPSKISRLLLEKLDVLREIVDAPVIVTSGFRPNTTSQHSLGKAADIIVPSWDVTKLYELYKIAELVGFNGIGIYPKWAYKGQTLGGIHVDVRDKKARWMGVPKPGGGQEYIGLTEANLKLWGVIT